MIAIVDASVAVKWFVSEPGHTVALALLEQDIDFQAPDLILAESTNVFWQKVRRREMLETQASVAIAALPTVLSRLIPSSELSSRAFELARQLDHPAYDCFYLAAAEKTGSMLVTADRSFVRRTGETAHRGLAVDLDDWEVAIDLRGRTSP